MKAKYRSSHSGDQVQYKPAVGRDTNSGPLVATKEYLTTLEQNLLGLANHLEQSVRRKTHSERTAHWFRCDTSLSSPVMNEYSGTSDKGPSEIGRTSLQRTLVSTPC